MSELTGSGMAARLFRDIPGECASQGQTAVAEWKRRRREVFIPLAYRAGDLVEVDSFDLLVDGVRPTRG